MKKIIFISAFLSVLACKNRKIEICNQKVRVGSGTILFHKTNSDTFHLPNSFVFDESTCIQLTDSQRKVVSVFDAINGFFFDLDFDHTILKKSALQPNFDVKGCSYFYANNTDTNFIFSPKKRGFFLFNSRGDSVDFISVTPDNNSLQINRLEPILLSQTGILINNGVLSCMGNVYTEIDEEDYETRYSKISIDLKTKQVSYSMKYPLCYKFGNWGGDAFRIGYKTAGKVEGTELISYPLSDSIMIINKFTGAIISRLPATDTSDICINDFGKPKPPKYFPTSFDIANHFVSNDSYKEILYIPKLNIYIRFLQHSSGPLQKSFSLNNIKQLELLAFDENFNFIGSKMLPKGLSPSNYFIVGDTFYFLNCLNKNENIAVYEEYTIEDSK